MKSFGNLLFLLLLFQAVPACVHHSSKEINYIRVVKSERKLYTYNSDYELIKMYNIALGKQPVGKKIREGDKKTPEGRYIIEAKNPNSAYFLSLKISYPNVNDIKRAQKLRVRPGNNIMIHGLKNGFGFIGQSHIKSDWTEGCIALTDEEIQEVFDHTQIGTKVEILP